MSWSRLDENDPSDDAMIGDEPFDLISNCFQKFTRLYKRDWKRKPSLRELVGTIQAVLETQLQDFTSDGATAELVALTFKTRKIPRRQKYAVGDILMAEAANGEPVYARILENSPSLGPIVGVYDSLGMSRMDLDAIIRRPLAVMAFPIHQEHLEKRAWLVIGNRPETIADARLPRGFWSLTGSNAQLAAANYYYGLGPPDRYIERFVVKKYGNEQVAAAVVEAIRGGDLITLNRLLVENPDLAASRIGMRTLLHVATDWPGHFPNVAAVVTALIAAGADPNAIGVERSPETPLHWAASSDDVEAIDALIDGGADIDAQGASLGGAALDEAIGYGQWRAARRLVERGAKVRKLWQAAALGIMPIIEEYFSTSRLPSLEAVKDAFWHACRGGQRQAAECLLARGADLNGVPRWTKESPLDIAHASGATDVADWLRGLGARPGEPPS